MNSWLVLLICSFPVMLLQTALGQTVGIYSQLQLKELASNGTLNELASNGTSFDTVVKEIVLNLPPNDQDEIIRSMIGIGDSALKVAAICGLQPDNKDTIDERVLVQCDKIVSQVHELCQGTQYEVSVCISPVIPEYMATRNLSDGQTDKIVYAELLSQEHQPGANLLNSSGK